LIEKTILDKFKSPKILMLIYKIILITFNQYFK